jgi:amino acid adenylation domain-containing protein
MTISNSSGSATVLEQTFNMADDDVFVVPLSFAQQRLWFLDQLEPGTSLYNMPAALRLTGRLDAPILERTLREIIRRHEVLRTTFAVLDEQPMQVIAPAQTQRLPVIDLSDLAEERRESEATALIGMEAQGPFDLSTGPLLRATLLKLSAEEHIILLTMHHIVSDGWSMGVLVREVAALYEAYVEGRESPLAELTIQYADFALWQQEWLSGEVLEGQLQYWKRQLGGAPAVLDLPTDRARPPIQLFRGAEESLTLSTHLSEQLKMLSEQQEATLFMTLLAAFQTLLSRYTGQDDIVVGTPIAGRTHSETEGLIGVFVNTLVLRTDMSGDPSFRELLGRVREVALEAYAHQDMPFEKLVEELEPERNLSHTPLFQVMFMLQHASPESSLKLSGLRLSPVAVEGTTAKFDLTLSMAESKKGLRASLEYNTALFDVETVKRMMGHLERLFEGIVSEPEQRLSELPLLTKDEKRQLLSGWKEVRREPHGNAVHHLFEQQAERKPNNIAISFGEQRLTYRELNERANQLAHYLRASGVGPDTLVGLYLERSVEMIVGLLGILKAGGAYVPLDQACPKERLAFMLEDTAVAVLLTQERLQATLPDHVPQVICLDTVRALLAQESVANPASATTAENLAYIIYTSGSTGKPKGVMVTHANIVRLFKETHAWFEFSESDTWTLFHSYAFDFSVWELWGALLYGGRLVVVPYIVSRSPEAFFELLSAERVTVLNQTPSAFRQLIKAAETQSDVRDLSLRLVIFGGEALELKSLRPWIECYGDEQPHLVNMYGITETTVHVTYRPLTKADILGPMGSGVGRPIPDLQVYILNKRQQLAPIGVPGEIYVGGEGLARGYLNRAALTAEKFFPNPFGKEPGARLYKTGDSARYLLDGNIEFLGRIDHQVKVRGFRIELGEIEAVLSAQPGVREAVVIVREEDGEKRLVGYVVTEGQSAPVVQEMRRVLQQQLPEYMVPSAIVQLPELPLTPNGKVDRCSLPDSEMVQLQMGETFFAARDLLELKLINLWEEMLGSRPIGVRDKFFEIGGHSLLAVRLMARIERDFGERLPLAALFQEATVEHLATLLRHRANSASHSSLVGIKTLGSKRPFFCVHPATGNVLCYVGLTRHLDSDQPFYGFQSAGLDEGCVPWTSVQRMAAHYVAELRTVQPTGPYLIGGYSMGGVVAFEMAQQLYEQSQRVSLLALIDAKIVNPHEWPEDADGLNLLANFARDLGLSLGHLTLSTDHLRQLDQDARLRYILEQARTDDLVPPDLEFSQIRRLWHVFKTNYNAMRNYLPAVYPGRLTLFRASENAGKNSHDLTDGWGALAAGGVEIHTVPGNHYSIVREPNVRVLAELLKTCLAEIVDG